jgi:hypothetical protein
VYTDNGRTALKKSNKFNVLYKFSLHCPDDRMYNSTLSKLFTVINVCQEKSLLPLNSPKSSNIFDLGEAKVDDSGKLHNIDIETIRKQLCRIVFIYNNILYEYILPLQTIWKINLKIISCVVWIKFYLYIYSIDNILKVFFFIITLRFGNNISKMCDSDFQNYVLC